MFTTLKFKALHHLLGWLLKFYDPHHDLKLREHIDWTRGQVYLFIRDKWRRNFHRQTWNCRSNENPMIAGRHERNCPHQKDDWKNANILRSSSAVATLEVHAEIDKVVGSGPPEEKKKMEL